MSEQYPLLCEEFSDEDKFSARYQRRQPQNLRGRARNHLKGAAVIMKRWPEHWTSILTYWWIGLGMIALTTFIIYNSLFSIAVLQPTDIRPTKYRSLNTITHTTKPKSPSSVFMHLFVNDNEKEDLNKYLPYIEVFANKYKDFTYDLIIVTNYTNREETNLPDEKNNDIALNLLWANVNYGNLASSSSNIKLKYVTLTNYLNDSPIKKYWDRLPHQFIPFLARAISVWEKGGIAINPIILTPQSPHTSYVDKFVSVIKQFQKYNAKAVNKQYQEPSKKYSKMLPKVNNIQDIINALENHDSSDDTDKEILHSVESKNHVVVATTNKLIPIEKHDSKTVKQDALSAKQYPDYFADSEMVTTEAQNQVTNTNEEKKGNNSSNYLPLFLEYLFRNKKPKSSHDTLHSIKKRRSPKVNELAKIEDNTDSDMRKFWDVIKSTDSYKPMIVNAKGVTNNTAANNIEPTSQDVEPVFELTVDLKGNMIATETPCHAFIGDMFTNALHHDVSESLTDFIIKELSIFCKGLLASCTGINVILV